jgi:muramidase (phage lysozyme)
MNQPQKLMAVGLLALVGWRVYVALKVDGPSGSLPADGWLSGADSILSSAAQSIDSFTGGFMKISAMAGVDPGLVNHPNVRAMLAVIRTGEGTTSASGYQTLFGGGKFTSLSDHPRIVVKRSGFASTAAGAYQFLASSWDETKRIMGLPDFSPASQDVAAVGRLAARGALADVVRGDFRAAIAKINKEWASLPGSPYGQPVMTMATAQQVFVANGGQVVA